MRYLTWLFVLLVVGGCSGGPVGPSVPDVRWGGSLPSDVGPWTSGDLEALQGGKACRLTPADPTLIPTGYYVCENGTTFYQDCPSTGCPRVLPMPKKHLEPVQ